MNSQPIQASALVSGDSDHELASIVALIRSRVLPAHKISTVIDNVGSAVKLVQLSEEDRLLAGPANASHEVIGAVTAEGLGEAMRDVHEWRDRDLDVRTVLDPTYPANLHSIFDRSPLVFVAGSWLEKIDSRSVAVVGTRRPSKLGTKRARRLSKELVEAKFSVISGLAAGIDTAAHTTALRTGGRTIAVMGTGLDHRYPPQNAVLAERILGENGALISQFFPHQPPTRWTFPLRNVVMSGLSLATIVVEASETSGARMQARVALQHGRTVFLLNSLVEKHDWARKYVSQGAYETVAIQVSSTKEIVDRLEGTGAADMPLAV